LTWPSVKPAGDRHARPDRASATDRLEGYLLAPTLTRVLALHRPDKEPAMRPQLSTPPSPAPSTDVLTAEHDVIAVEDLIEEISIDGMCGVY
jgi:mycofactocin precursor